MNLIVNNLRIPVEKDGVDEYVTAVSEKLNIYKETIRFIKILAKTLDASNKDQFYYDISIAVNTPDSFVNANAFPLYTEKIKTERRKINSIHKPIIIGFGPAGMFAALELIEYGLKPIIFERGKKIEERSVDIQKFIKERILNPESNIQFGEGGAGSYSDGKLFSRINNTEYVMRVLNTYIRFGAPEKIAYLGKPHLGTDVLCRIVRNIRDYILAQGGEIYYGSKMTDILTSDGQAMGIVINGEKEYRAAGIYLAVGHSARDTFEMMHRKGIIIEQKPISVGMRVEHPVEVINHIRYGNKYKDYCGIGAASYSFNYNDKINGRGIHTFCMCPGGEVINASSEDGMLAVNGMSYSQRASAFSNAAIVVTCNTRDYGSTDPLAGIEFQRAIERKAFHSVGGTWQIPAQNLADYLSGKSSASLNKNSSAMGAASVDMHGILPAFVNTALISAFNIWKTDCPLFILHHATLLGAETRASAPIRIIRSERYESINIKNLYPIGEGSGYTGGIMSSATDAIKAVERSLRLSTAGLICK